jgi:hypothetical protein
LGRRNIVTTEVNGSSVDLDKIQADFAFRAPIALRMLCEEKALEEKLPLTAFLRKVVAEAMGYTLQGTENGQRKLSDEEKKARIEAQKAKDKAARELNKQLLKEAREKLEAEAKEEEEVKA